MTTLRRRVVLAVVAGTVAVTTALSATTAAADDDRRSNGPDKPEKNEATVQLLSFNDFHGHLQAEEGQVLDEESDPGQHVVGGSEYLAATLDELRAEAPGGNSLTVAAGDLIGGSTFLSGLFHDEPTIEAMEALGLDVSSVGNHEFDEGTTELLRMQYGGCHPEDGCYFPDQPYDGAEFNYLAANVEFRGSDETLLPPYSIQTVDVPGRGHGGRHGDKGDEVEVGFIGMTTDTTPALVSPSGVDEVEFLDEVETANRYAEELKQQGVETIVVLLHEGGFQAGTYNGCEGISGPVVDIAEDLDAEIDAVVTGHTHEPYVCTVPDPAGEPRTVTSAASFGGVVTELELVVNTRSGDVKRDEVEATNHLVLREGVQPDSEQTAIIEKWNEIAAPIAGEVVGTVAEPVTGDESTDRAHETPMVDLIADAILWGTSGDNGGAQMAFMNVGGVRSSFDGEVSGDEQQGEITYAEAYDVAPFGNLLVTMDLTGAQIEEVLEQQYQPIPDRGSRPMLALGVSEGFSYTWDASQPEGERVVPGSMTLNGEPVQADQTYRVATLNFLAEGGDSFTAFTQGTNVLGGAEDLANLVAFLEAHPGLTPPPDRVDGL